MENIIEIKNVLSYRRVSTTMQVTGFSLDNQQNSIINYCKNHDYNLLEEFEDAGISGKNINSRPALNELLARLTQSPKIDAVVIWKLSRISRNMIDLVGLIETFKKNDVILISIEDGIDTSKGLGTAFVYMAGIFAQLERENIASQSIAAREEMANQGGWNGGCVSYGYNLETVVVEKDGKMIEEKRLTKKDGEWQVVEKIYELYSRNWGYDRINQYLNGKGIKTKKENAWTSVALITILENPIYCGYIRYGLYRNKKRKGTIEKVIFKKAEDNFVETIITKEFWDEIQEVRQKRSTNHEKTVNIKYLLSGLPTCPQCGSKMIHQRGSGKDKNGKKIIYSYYACSKYVNYKGGLCKSNLVKSELLEKQVIAEIKQFVNTPNIITELEKRLGEKIDTKDLENDIKNLENKLNKLKSDEDKYYSYLVDSEALKTLKKEKLLELITNVSESLVKTESELNSKKSQVVGINEQSLNFEKIAFMLKNFEQLLEIADFEKKKQLLHCLIKEIKIAPEKKIKDRKATEIILNFSDTDIAEVTHLKTNKNEGYNMVRLNVSSRTRKNSHIIELVIKCSL